MIDIKKIKTYSVLKRKSKVNFKDFARPPEAGRAFSAFYQSLPNILKAGDFRAVVNAVISAHKKQKSVIFMSGAHLIKCGLNPVLIELMKKKIITCVCLNGAGIIHDFEIALQGKTSEDVAFNLKDGNFGMGRETADFINNAIKAGVKDGLGLGQAVASKIVNSKLPYKKMSLLYNAYINNVPVCVFVAIGTDIIHQHPSFDAAATGEGSRRDFYRLTEELIKLNDGGAILTFGSAVIMPEVFLKALNLCRNLGNSVKNFTTANFDMLQQYRPLQNVVNRPTADSGKGYYIIGHHEIMFPLLGQAIMDNFKKKVRR